VWVSMAVPAPCAASVFAFTLLPVADTAACVSSCPLCGPRKPASETLSRYSCGLPITARRVRIEPPLPEIPESRVQVQIEG
jgi:hypothetical protein